jgi:hypothetical protein
MLDVEMRIEHLGVRKSSEDLVNLLLSVKQFMTDCCVDCTRLGIGNSVHNKAGRCLAYLPRAYSV